MAKRRHGDALYERGKGKITTWYLDAWINGTRHQRWLGRGISRRVAQELAQVIKGQILKGEAGIGTKRKEDPTFDDAVKKFVDWMKSDKKPHTVRTYSACLRELGKTFNGQRLSAITPWSLESYKKTRGEGRQLGDRPADVSEREWKRRCRVAECGAPVRANRELATLKALFNRCRDWGMYEGANPMSKVKFKKEPRTRLRFLEPEEEARLLAVCDEPLRTLILVALNTGLRVHAEAMTLQWASVDLKRGTLTVESAYAKNGKTRTVPLNSVVRAALEQLPRKGDVVFRHGSVGKAFRKACRAAKITGVTPHTLRHTFATRLCENGVDLRMVQELGGWASLALVQRYAHVTPSRKAEAIEGLVCPVASPYAVPKAIGEGAAPTR